MQFSYTQELMINVSYLNTSKGVDDDIYLKIEFEIWVSLIMKEFVVFKYSATSLKMCNFLVHELEIGWSYCLTYIKLAGTTEKRKEESLHLELTSGKSEYLKQYSLEFRITFRTEIPKINARTAVLDGKYYEQMIS